MIKQITHESQLLAIIVSHKFNESGVHFFTDDNLSQQLAFMKHDQGRIIQPHVHNPIVREICDMEMVFLPAWLAWVGFPFCPHGFVPTG